jgi:predicted O-methyltransferase YrrM
MLVLEPLGQLMNRSATFERVSDWPERVSRFEDLAFLFVSSMLNSGIADLAFDEAAYIYRLVAELPAATIAEIGRFKGGSTFLIASAMDDASELWSYDIHVKLTNVFSGEQLDDELREALVRYGLAERVHLIVADSRTAEPPPRQCDLVFVDGDHTYKGVRDDYEHWGGQVRPGGHLLFHDAAGSRPFATRHVDVARLVGEIEQNDGDRFERRGGAGSLVHFVRMTTVA